uniref:AC4 protein n=1 Tax=Tomato leaf curl New Delhi virus [India:Bangalore:OY135:2005] TaxID=908117 RepID=E7BQ43_9GEMI|nr:AC4 protein [Tomato leaf curl New Delhi virus [India:Bangalore:OY135:2005]]
MGHRISMFLSNSRENSNARITDSSTWCPQVGQHISIRTFRELNQHRTSKRTSTKTETSLSGVFSRSMDDLLVVVRKQQTMHMLRRLTQEIKMMPSKSLKS